MPRAEGARIGAVALPRWLARVNLAFGSYIMRPIASYLPWFGVLEHVGRRSGTVRRVPLTAFHHRGGRWVIALVYGPDVQWLKNVLAAGQCRLYSMGRWHALALPRRFADPRRKDVPWLVRPVLAVLRVDEFVELTEVDA